MLSDDESRRLDEIERDLLDDPQMARKFGAGRPARVRLVAADVIALIGLTLILTGVMIAPTHFVYGISVLGFGFFIIGGALVIGTRRRPN